MLITFFRPEDITKCNPVPRVFSPPPHWKARRPWGRGCTECHCSSTRHACGKERCWLKTTDCCATDKVRTCQREGGTAYENKGYTHQIEIRIKLLKETLIHGKTEVVVLICTCKLQSGFNKRLRNATSIWPTLASENSRFSSLLVVGDVSRDVVPRKTSPAARSEEKRLFSLARPTKAEKQKISEHSK